jgi:hypothetical protein
MNVGNIGSAQGAAAEAMETAAQTKAEAAAGDQQAVQKLARGQVGKPVHAAQKPAQAAQAPAEPSQPSAGPADGKLDVKA